MNMAWCSIGAPSPRELCVRDLVQCGVKGCAEYHSGVKSATEYLMGVHSAAEDLRGV